MAIYKNNKNGKWYYQFMLNGERKHGLCYGATDKKSAGQYENVVKVRLIEQQLGVRAREEKNVPLYKLKAIFESYAQNNKQSYNRDIYTLKIILSYFGANTVAQQIEPKNIEGFKRYLKQERKVKNSTINRYVMILSKMFSLGIDNGILSKNPVSRTTKLREDNHKIRYLTKDEEKRLFKEIEKEYEVLDRYTRKKKRTQPYLYLKPIVITALQTGMRKGEILNLEWTNIDFKDNFIELLKTKSGKARKIPISATLKNVLNEIPKTSNYVFVNPQTNKPYVDLKRSFHNVLKNANIENFRFHDLRHTVATRLVEKGIDLVVVQDILGHSKVSTTQRYAHPVPERKMDAVEILSSYFSEQTKPS